MGLYWEVRASRSSSGFGHYVNREEAVKMAAAIGGVVAGPFSDD